MPLEDLDKSMIVGKAIRQIDDDAGCLALVDLAV